MPSPSPPPRRARADAELTATLLTERLAELALDVGHDPVLRVEEALAYRAPAAEIRNREELRRLREVELPEHVLEHRPVARLAEDALRVRRAHEVDERLRSGTGALDDRD